MEVRPGYKQTEVGVIPEDWSIKSLPEVCRFRGGKAHEKFIRTSGRFICVNSKFISSDGAVRKYSIENFCCAKKNDILMVMSDLPNGQALAKAFLADQEDTYAVNQRVCALTPYRDYPSYLYYVLNRNPYFLKFDDGINQTHLLNPVFRKCPVIVPPTKTEQEAIAGALSDADALIESLEQLIVKKRRIKQGAMQELLTGKKRLPGFSGEWAEQRLGDIAEVIMGQSPSSQFYNRVGDGLPLIQGNADVSNRKAIARIYTSEVTKRGRAGDILLSVRAPVGEISRTDFDVCLGRGVCAIRSFNDLLYYALVQKEPCWSRHSKGSTFDSVNSSDVKGFGILIPECELEQVEIAAVLSDMDSEITALEARLTKARGVKQGMMQQLLTGRIRLVKPEIAPVSIEHRAQTPKAPNRTFKDAVIISVLTKLFGSKQYPLGRQRYTKLSYLLYRHIEKKTEGYLKKAAGPYNPKTKYGGSERIALENGYVRKHKSGNYEGFVVSDNIAQAEGYFIKWFGQDCIEWLERFRYVKNAEFEVLATVDMAAVELSASGNTVDVSSIEAIIRNHPEWKAKLSRSEFSKSNIKNAIQWSNRLFGD